MEGAGGMILPDTVRIQIGDNPKGILLADLIIYLPNGKTLCVTHNGIIFEKPDWKKEKE